MQSRQPRSEPIASPARRCITQQFAQDRSTRAKAPRARIFRNLTTPRLTKSNTTYFFTRRMKPSSSPVFRGVSPLRFWTCRPASVIAPPRSGLGAFGVRVMKPAWGFSSCRFNGNSFVCCGAGGFEGAGTFSRGGSVLRSSVMASSRSRGPGASSGVGAAGVGAGFLSPLGACVNDCGCRYTLFFAPSSRRRRLHNS